MAFGTRFGVCFFFFLTFFILSSARNPIFFSNEDDEGWSMVGRSLKAINLEDYDGPTANQGHNPFKGGSNSWRDHVGKNG